MSMRLLSFRIVVLSTLLIILPIYSYGQDNTTSRYELKVDRYRKGFSSLIPRHSRIHLYGDVGVVSLGFGWDYGRDMKWETGIMFGLVPKYNSGEAKVTFTLRQGYSPWRVPIGGNFSVVPLMCGLQFSSVLNDEFWAREPDKYPSSYYGFSTKIRAMIFLGQGITYEIPYSKRLRSKSITMYYEIGSCELYIISAFTNKYWSPKDYLRFAFGLKFQIF